MRHSIIIWLTKVKRFCVRRGPISSFLLCEVLEEYSIYSSYLEHRYGSSCIVFDGYENVLLTKDHEHGRRQVGNISADV